MNIPALMYVKGSTTPIVVELKTGGAFGNFSAWQYRWWIFAAVVVFVAACIYSTIKTRKEQFYGR